MRLKGKKSMGLRGVFRPVFLRAGSLAHRGPTMGPLALRDAIAGLQRRRWHSGTPSRAYNGVAGTQGRHRGPTTGPLISLACHSRDRMAPLALRNAIPETEWGRWHSGIPFPGQNGAAGTQESHSRDGMAPLALRNPIPETEWRRWHSGIPFPRQNGAAGTQESQSQDGMAPLALRNAIPKTEWRRKNEGPPPPGRGPPILWQRDQLLNAVLTVVS